MSVILFIIVFSILILAHEFGHFIVAKKSGIRVDEFGFGFPPRLFKFKKGETIYSFNIIPFGGFVKIFGEEGGSAKETNSFASKSVGVKALVISAGVILNLFFGWFLFSVGFMAGLPTSASSVPFGSELKDVNVAIVQVAPNSPAEKAGIKDGDLLIDFANMTEVQDFISANKGREVKIRHKRGKEIFSAKLTPRIDAPAGEGSVGIAMDEIGILKLPWHRAIWEGLKTTYQLAVAIALGIFDFIVGAFKGLVGINDVLGPVGIVNAAGSVAKLGFSYLLSFVAFLSINLAVLNILPFPALDGGRLLFLAIEKIKGSPVNPRWSSIIHGAGLAILLIFMFAVTYKDILRLI